MSETNNLLIELEETGSGGRYIASIPGKGTAELTFSKTGETMIIIDHTGVPETLRGTGVGKALVERAIIDARKAGKKVAPLCPFAKAMIGKHTDWQDVL